VSAIYSRDGHTLGEHPDKSKLTTKYRASGQLASTALRESADNTPA